MCVRSAPANGSKNSIFSYRNIHECYLECRKNKRNSINALRFEFTAEEEILKLQRQLKNKTYRPSRSILFAAKKPKIREIFAADFRDRVTHHILIKHLEKIWEPVFIHDSYACRKGKGTHKGVARLQSFLKKITKNGNIRACYLQLDIKDFFPSINKEILFSLIRKRLSDPDVLWLAKTIIFWDCTQSYILRGQRNLLSRIPPNKTLFGKDNKSGLPIGNLSSQFFANVYLNELDRFVKHSLKARYYLRYVDDFIILGYDPAELSCLCTQIENFVRDHLKLRLHPTRRKLLSVAQGIDFLGYVTRHDYILVRRRVVNNLKQKISEFKRSRNPDTVKMRAALSSYFGHFKHANTYKLKNRILNTIGEKK